MYEELGEATRTVLSSVVSEKPPYQPNVASGNYFRGAGRDSTSSVT